MIASFGSAHIHGLVVPWPLVGKEEFAQVKSWSAPLDRWHQAVQMVKRAKERRQIVEGVVPGCIFNNYMDGLFEALEVHDIVEVFHGDSSPALKSKLMRALCGPLLPFDEQPKNSDARNTMFQLSLAADCKNAGSEIELGEPDIKFRTAGALFIPNPSDRFQRKRSRKYQRSCIPAWEGIEQAR